MAINKTKSGIRSLIALPHLVFIESACPAFLSKRSNGSLFIYTEGASKFAPAGQRLIVVSTFLMRYLKILGALFRFPCTFQGGFGIAYELSKTKSVISDGILTEWLIKKGHIKPTEFISVTNLVSHLNVNANDQLIIGSNWYEFGTFSLKRYEEYLRALNQAYPEALYFPHPKEGREIPKKIFGIKLIEFDRGIETYCVQNGLPGKIIGFLGSTAMASLGKSANSMVKIDAINIDASICDGPVGDISDPFLLKKRSIRVTLQDLEDTVVDIMGFAPHVTITKKKFIVIDHVPIIV